VKEVQVNSDQAQSAASHRDLPSEAAVAQPNLKDPRVVLSLLEADQIVAAKRQTHFGRRPLSPRERVLLWGFRIYVAVMLVIVAITVIQAVGAAH
jgi:hypothetical protein